MAEQHRDYAAKTGTAPSEIPEIILILSHNTPLSVPANELIGSPSQHPPLTQASIAFPENGKRGALFE